MDLRYSHKDELLHSLFVAIVARKNICANMNLKYFHVVELFYNSFITMVTMITIATR